jgi:beta-lactamase class A
MPCGTSSQLPVERSCNEKQPGPHRSQRTVCDPGIGIACRLHCVIGNPFGLEGSMTLGIVSAVGRVIQPQASRFSIVEMIQTDAPINPGNSGGPLLDSRGRVIGINTLIFSQTGASAGVGFAVPVNTVRRVVPELIARGQYDHPWQTMNSRTGKTMRRIAAWRFHGLLVLVLLAIAACAPLQGTPSETLSWAVSATSTTAATATMQRRETPVTAPHRRAVGIHGRTEQRSAERLIVTTATPPDGAELPKASETGLATRPPVPTDRATDTATRPPQPTFTPGATATPVPKHTSEFTERPLAELSQDAASFLVGQEGARGAAVVVFSQGAIYTQNGDELMPMASVAKVAIMVTVMDRAIHEDRELTDWERAMLQPMITESDNDAATALWNDLGGGATLEGTLRSMGLVATRPNPAEEWGESRSTPKEVALLLAKLVNGEILDPPSRNLALDLMSQVAPDQMWGITAGVLMDGLPQMVIAIKNGWYPTSDGWWVNSAGSILPGNGQPAYTIAVLTQQQPSLEYGIATIEGVAIRVHAALQG